MTDLAQYSNSELEEMGIRPPCPCLSTYIEYVDNDIYLVCVDCDGSLLAGQRVAAW